MLSESDKEWTEVIRPKRTWYDINLSEVWKYRDLVLIFVRRDFVAGYKQTILGPLWYIFQPLLTTIVFTIIFDKFAHISTNATPSVIFYMTGITAWNYFASCITKTSGTFINNAGIFGKVYFPRLTVPVSIVISNLITFCVQFLFMMGFWVYYYLIGANIYITPYIFLIPVLLLLTALMGLGFGIIISSLTTKYKDLQFVVNFGVQLLMYATPIIYPLSSIPDKYKIIIMLNPMTSIIETFKYALLGRGTFSWEMLGYSGIFTLVILIIGLLLFNKIEQRFIDTI
ncbi:MAG TPA: ABC transporter permease [Bacteroidales bacterium]|nr:ABC transporter permease [Bacteroidales bacterium]HQI46788.1 ABC transporter permease [Bacteroidales bacterium]